MESCESQKIGEDQRASSDSLRKDARLNKQGTSTSSSDDVQSMIIRVLDDIVGRVSESDRDDHPERKSNADNRSEKKSEKRRKSRQNKASRKKNEENKKENDVKGEEVKKSAEDEVKIDLNNLDETKEDVKLKEQIGEIINNEIDGLKAEENGFIEVKASSSKDVEENPPSLDHQNMEDEDLNTRNLSPDDYNYMLNYFRDANYWQQSAVIDTDHNSVPVCEKLVVQSMPNMTQHQNQLKLNQQGSFGLSVLASRSPSQVNVSEVEKQRAGFQDYGHCNELLCKIHARSKIARQLRKKSRLESKQFTLPTGYKVAYSSNTGQNRSYKFNKSKHHYQPPVQFQRSLSCSVAVLNSISLPSKKHRSKRHRDSSDSSSTAAKKPILLSHKKPKLNFHQILTLICLASLAFASQCSMSIIAPFFPLTASEKGVTESVSGLVFSIHAFTVMVASPFFGIITPKLGAKRVLLAGILGSSLAIVAFGALDYIDDTVLFISLCFIVRICEALGSCAFSTVSYIYIMNEFSNDVGWAFGLLETFVGLGMSLGPGIGGGLYGLGGYSLPFYLLGVATFLIFPLACYALDNINTDEITKSGAPKSQNEDSENLTASSSSYGSLNDSSFTISSESYQEQLTYWRLIKIPSVLIISLVIIVVSQSQGFLDPTLEPHLRTFGIEPWLVGIVFLAMSTAYAICSPIVGWLASKIKNKFIIMLAGLAITFFGLLLVGPTTIISTNPSIYFSLAGMIIIGIGFATSFIPTFEAILLAVVKNEHYDDNLITYSIVSGYWSSMFALGETIGPIIGGLALEFLDFVAASTIMAIICFCAVILVVVAVFIGEMNEDASSVESSYSTTTDSESSSFEENTNKKSKLGHARNYQSSLYGSEEEKEYNEKSNLLA